MGQIKVEKNVGGIEGLCVIEPAVHGDARGYFMETYNEKDMKEAGIDIHFVQDNQSMSTKGVLRGLHFQKQYPQCKLVRAVRGTVFDVAVDLRSNSETYGKWYGVTLSAENKKQFLIPEGFAHGFLVMSDEAEFCYKVNDFWHPNDEGGMAWNDPEIGIELMSRDELSVMDGSKCILQLRGVRPFLSDKFDITKHKRYKELSDFDKKNAFDVERYLKHELRLRMDEEFDCYEVDVSEESTA